MDFLIFLNLDQLCPPWRLTLNLSFEAYPRKYSSQFRPGESHQRGIQIVWNQVIYHFWFRGWDFSMGSLDAW